jgi:hypothetical protein
MVLDRPDSKAGARFRIFNDAARRQTNARPRMLARIVPLLALLMLLPLAPDARAADAGIALDPKVGLNAYSALVDQEFEHTRAALRILAASDNARSGDWSRIQELLAILAKGAPTSAAVWFARPDGSYFTADGGRTSQNLKTRGYFPALMAGRVVAGELVVSKSTGRRSAIFAAPVRSAGRVIGAVGVSMDLEKVAGLVDDKIALPGQVMFYALDRRGQIALHRQSTLLFEFAAKLGSPTLTEAVTEMLAKPEGVVRYQFQGAQRTAIFKRSDATGWVYALRW